MTVTDLGELLLTADEAALAHGPRTVLQERMLETFADFAGLQLEPAASTVSTTSSEEPSASKSGTPETSKAVNLNTASHEELQSLPHIGPERAEAVISMRPIQKIEELQAIDGIGAARLRAIRNHRVRV